ncbi:cof-like hydrolase [Enterococcus haemoperoxidus ATCC BAA-382]|uniref:Cof-like hydrolase n=1 Tax=Enterococcus haemoperoxidus ATCC BAA-382 TaxID=1158608 RepID=R2SWF1_9ENTE|nr:Cof-type HAD-IIB family hydrolase [Enterococcus haemoperoxidus]EOH97136.1 cof-like hydrolase [Enterococcus haemoperoxidus ATCC BAA-382]EOT59949.1 HAD superfamily hydrolase [Enterococcus haemoperoxidus ATCC BAA-382]OJG56130.1 cof-like hydrolase [Enterococcus haemoperoxidus]
MRRKLFAFDIDGTLLGTDRQPLESTREALKSLRQQGHLVTIATGRSRFMAQDIILDLDFSNYVLCNGAAAFLDHEQYYQNLLDQDELHRFASEVEKREIGLAYVGLDDVKKNNHHRRAQMVEAMGSIDFEAPEYDVNFQKENDVYQALAFYDDSADGMFDREFSKFRFIRWHSESVDIVPNNGSKAATLLNLADRVGIAREDIITFGDGENDREMLREAGIGVAMGNALPHIQKEAKIVTDTNDNDGIWKALKELKAI